MSWLLDSPPPVDLETWRLVIAGLVDQPQTLTYRQIANMADASLQAIIDCTGG